jgi:hypothetical protein
MASTYAKQTCIILCKQMALFCIMSAGLQACKSDKMVYNSSCDAGIDFQKINFSKLINNIKKYDGQYVEVSGTYLESKEQSALFNDSLFTDHSNKHALWINFSQDCPLYLKGTHTGLFEPTNGEFVLISNKKIKIRGKIDLHNTGHLGLYKGTIDRVSFVQFN